MNWLNLLTSCGDPMWTETIRESQDSFTERWEHPNWKTRNCLSWPWWGGWVKTLTTFDKFEQINSMYRQTLKLKHVSVHKKQFNVLGNWHVRNSNGHRRSSWKSPGFLDSVPFWIHHSCLQEIGPFIPQKACILCHSNGTWVVRAQKLERTSNLFCTVSINFKMFS